MNRPPNRANDRQAVAQDIILVDECNRFVGTAKKQAAHEHALLHRAFSIFLTDAKGRFLLQRRNRDKYHSGGLWSNSCCGHPRPGERTLAAAKRRMFEELGVTSDLKFGFFARYSAALDNNMHENELVYVFSGQLKEEPRPNLAEIDEIRYMSMDEVRRYIRGRPQETSYWMRHYFAVHGRSLHALSVAAGQST